MGEDGEELGKKKKEEEGGLLFGTGRGAKNGWWVEIPPLPLLLSTLSPPSRS